MRTVAMRKLMWRSCSFRRRQFWDTRIGGFAVCKAWLHLVVLSYIVGGRAIIERADEHARSARSP